MKVRVAESSTIDPTLLPRTGVSREACGGIFYFTPEFRIDLHPISLADTIELGAFMNLEKFGPYYLGAIVLYLSSVEDLLSLIIVYGAKYSLDDCAK